VVRMTGPGLTIKAGGETDWGDVDLLICLPQIAMKRCVIGGDVFCAQKLWPSRNVLFVPRHEIRERGTPAAVVAVC